MSEVLVEFPVNDADGRFEKVPNGIRAILDDSQLERRDIEIDNENEHTFVTEYWLKVPIHRDVAVNLKRGIALDIQLGDING